MKSFLCVCERNREREREREKERERGDARVVTYAPAARTFVCENTIQVYRFVSLSQKKKTKKLHTDHHSHAHTYTLSRSTEHAPRRALCTPHCPDSIHIPRASSSSFGEPVDEQKECAAAHDCCKDDGVLALLAADRTHDVIEDRELGAYRINLAVNVREETSLLHNAAHRCLGAPNNLHKYTQSQIHTHTERERERDAHNTSDTETVHKKAVNHTHTYTREEKHSVQLVDYRTSSIRSCAP